MSGRELPFMGSPLLAGWQNLAFYPDSHHLTFGTASGMIETWEARRSLNSGVDPSRIVTVPKTWFSLAA